MTGIDKYQAGIEEVGRFHRWLREHVPARYRKMTETAECFSAFQDFNLLYSASEAPYERRKEKRKNLSDSNVRLAKKFPHLLGNRKYPCERCLRVINTYDLYQARHHPEILTPDANTIIALELHQRNIEHSTESRGYKGDGLYLLQVIVSEKRVREGENARVHETKLILYDENSVRRGQATLDSRLRNHPELKDFTKFKTPKVYSFHDLPTRFFSTSSSTYSRSDEEHKETIVEIFSRSVS